MARRIDTAAIEAAVEVVEEVEGRKAFDPHVTLANGVVLRLKPTSPLLIRRAVSVLERDRPKPPKVFLDDKGREEENPSDPQYIEDIARYEGATFDVALNIMLTLGADIEHVPDNVPSLESDEWVETLDFLGVDLDLTRPAARKLAWVQYIAMSEGEDVANVVAGVGRLSGLPEAEIEAAVSSFRSRTGRDSDNGASPQGD